MNQTEPEEVNDKPPFFNSWNSMYRLVLGVLLAQIILYYGITRIFE